MISLKRKQSGFTIVELLIVIVVIGILAAIVITTFTGVQKKGRDADRKSDINAIYSQLEVYFAENSVYPTLANLNDGDWRAANMQGLNDDALTDPSGSAGAVLDDEATSGGTYQYYYVPSDCGDDGCADFVLGANLENDENNFEKEGSNTPPAVEEED